MPYSVEIGRNIQWLRKHRRLSQEELAFQADISVTYLRAIERGRANFTIDVVESIAQVLRVHLVVLILLSMTETEVLAVMQMTRQAS